jgi:hypothetical protein
MVETLSTMPVNMVLVVVVVVESSYNAIGATINAPKLLKV